MASERTTVADEVAELAEKMNEVVNLASGFDIQDELFEQLHRMSELCEAWAAEMYERDQS